jgi:hypothetical protein
LGYAPLFTGGERENRLSYGNKIISLATRISSLWHKKTLGTLQHSPLASATLATRIMSSNVPPYQVDLIVAAAVGHSVLSIFATESQVQGRHGHPPRKRQRRSIKEIYDCLGPHYFRRAYRMTYDSFWILHSKIFCLIWHYAARAKAGKKRLE